MQIDQRAPPFLRDPPQRPFERGVAFASGGAENVSHQAVRVHADQHRARALFSISPRTSATCDSPPSTSLVVGNQAELAKARVHQRFAHAMHVALVRHAIANEFGDGEHL